MKNKYVQVLLIYIFIYVIAAITSGEYNFKLWSSEMRNGISILMVITFMFKIVFDYE